MYVGYGSSGYHPTAGSSGPGFWTGEPVPNVNGSYYKRIDSREHFLILFCEQLIFPASHTHFVSRDFKQHVLLRDCANQSGVLYELSFVCVCVVIDS